MDTGAATHVRGIEFMVSELTEGLIARGHEVTLFATGDSVTKGRLVSPWPASLWRPSPCTAIA